MATLTAVAAGGNWSSASTWSPAQVPTAADICKITGAMTGTVTIDGTAGSPNLCRSLDCTGATHTLAQSTNAVLNIGDGSGGNLKLVAGMTYAPDWTSVINFVSTTTGITITTAGKTMGNLNFNGAGGVWTLQDNLTLNTTGPCAITLTAGALHDNGKTVSTPAFSSDNSNTRALTMSGSWTIQGAGTVWDITTSTGMTLTATGSTIHLTSGDMQFQGGGLTYASVIISADAGNPPTIYGANTFTNLTYTGAATTTDSIIFAANQTVTGTLTINGNSVVNRILIKSDIKGTPRTLTTAANTISNADLQDITGAGASGWNLSAITGKSGNCGGCSGITFTTPTTCYMKTAASVNWSASNWYTTSGGSTSARVPLPQDTAIFDANSVTAGSVIITIDMPRVGAMDWTGVLNTPGLSGGGTSLFGDLTFVPGMYIGGNPWTFENRGSINLDCGGGVFAVDVVQNGPGGTVNQVADTGGNFGTFNVTAGTWNNGAYACMLDVLTIDGGTFNLGSGLLTIQGDGTTFGDLSAGTLEMNGNSIVLGTSGATSMSISGGVLNLSGQFDGTGVYATVLNVSGGTINDTGPAGELIATTVDFTGGTSVVRKLTTTYFSQSSTSSLTITGSATYDSWTWSGTDFTFTTIGVPTWSAGSLTLVANGGSWTFC